MDGSPLLATMAYRHRCAARHFFCCRHDCPLKKAYRGNARHSFSLLRKMEFRRASRTPAHSRFCPRRRPRTLDAHGCDGFIFFHSAGLSLDHLDINRLPDVAEFASGHGSRLAAISVAATFFGGLTYIGNSPNLLIRAIAESRHVPTPGFLTYIIRYALPILIPV